MKKNTILEITLLVAGILCFIGSFFSNDPFTKQLLKGGLYLLSALALTSKLIRFFPVLQGNKKLMWMVSVVLTYAGAITTFASQFKGANFVWLMGMVLFSFSSYPEQATRQEERI